MPIRARDDMSPYQHPHFQPPADSAAPCWRYRELDRFASCLVNGGLWFSSIVKLGDPREGTLTRSCLQRGDGGPFELAFTEEAYKERFLPDLRTMLGWTREWCFANCWTAKPTESYPMWKAYTATPQSLVLRTSYATLRRCLPDDIQLGMVRYLDHEKDKPDRGYRLSLVTCKALYHRDEEELRALYAPNRGSDPAPPGKFMQADFNQILEEIRLHPDSDPHFMDEVQQLLDDHGITVPLCRSEISIPIIN